MSDETLNNNDIQLIFKKLRAVPTNKSCFDCNAKLPTWSSVTYGVFICIDCSAVHRSLGVHLTFVRSTQLDTNWTWIQLRQMQLGGNANAESFFRQHNCITTDAQQKYNSRAAQLYREKLHAAAVQAMRIHGTKLHIEPSLEHPSSKEEKKEEVDFFEEHSTETEFSNDNQNLNVDNRSTNGNFTTTSKPALSPGAGPNVEAALSSVIEPQPDRKSIIGGRKPPAKKTGLGAKRGLGAQRVKADFSAIEREAEMADQLKAQEKTPTVPEKSQEEQEAQMVSMRLAYQDLGLQQKKEEAKLKTTDPKKAEQVERLGMGFTTRTGVSHSAFNSIKVIEQESPVRTQTTRYSRDEDTGYDDFFDTFTSSSMYKGNRTPTESSASESVFFDSLSALETMTNRNAPKTSSGWGESSGGDRNSSKTSSGWGESSGGGWSEPKSKGWRESINDSDWGDEKKTVQKNEWEEPERRQPSTRSSEKSTPKPSPSGGEAQKKFGAAKAISSDQYFADSSDTSWERKTNLSRFEGSSSISSADYFNRTEVLPGGSYGVQTPDLDDVKESVRQGVTKVAGKLSSLANGVMSSIQEKYGGY